MNQEKIGKFILECRRNKKLTQSELAEKLGVTDKSISNWENGRNMPDLSLFKPLCDILEISINDLISGEKVSKDKYQDKFEENLISTIDYTTKKIIEKNNVIGLLFIIFGVLLSTTAMTIFPSESSWGSVYSVLGAITSLIGVSKFTKKLSYGKRLIYNFGYFALFVAMLFILDYVSVVSIKQAPRFSSYKISADTAIYYDTPFYDVIRCNKDENNEYYKVLKNQNYDINDIVKYCEK